jgi:hypothetical protein
MSEWNGQSLSVPTNVYGRSSRELAEGGQGLANAESDTTKLSYLSERTVTDRTPMLPVPAFERHADIASENSSINARPVES